MSIIGKENVGTN